jgi:hypothetical protein
LALKPLLRQCQCLGQVVFRHRTQTLAQRKLRAFYRQLPGRRRAPRNLCGNLQHGLWGQRVAGGQCAWRRMDGCEGGAARRPGPGGVDKQHRLAPVQVQRMFDLELEVGGDPSRPSSGMLPSACVAQLRQGS